MCGLCGCMWRYLHTLIINVCEHSGIFIHKPVFAGLPERMHNPSISVNNIPMFSKNYPNIFQLNQFVFGISMINHDLHFSVIFGIHIPNKRWGGGAELRFERSFPDVSGSGPYQWVADQGKGRFPRVPWPPWHPATEMWKAPVLRWKHGTYGTRTGKQWCRYGKPTGFQGTWSTNGV